MLRWSRKELNRDGIAQRGGLGIAAGLLLGCLLFTYLGAMLLVIPAVLLLAALVRRSVAPGWW